jgi:hypothetical protein
MTKPVLSITASDGSRMYQHPLTREQVPSVTTIIKAGIPKPALVPWAAKMAAEHACANWLRLSKLPHEERILEIKNAHRVYTEKTADVGDVVHELVDCWSTGRAYPEWPKEVEKFADQFINFMIAKRPVFIENEVTLWSRTHGYAGSADFIAMIDRKVILGDVKTGRNVYPEVGLQLAALGHADFILRPDGTETPLPEIDDYAALHVRPRSWNLVHVNEIDGCFQAFLAAKQILDWERTIANKVVVK